MTASDIATKVAQRAGLQVGEVDCDHHRLRPRVAGRRRPTGSCCSGWRATIGFEITVREGKFALQPAGQRPRDAPAAGGADRHEPAGARAGHGPAAVPGRRHLRRAGEARSRCAAGTWRPSRRSPPPQPADDQRVELPTSTPPSWPRPSATRATCRPTCPYRTQAEVDAAARALAEAVAGAFAEFEGVARGNPELRAGAAVTIDGLGRAVRRQVHRHHVAAPLRPGTGYTTSFSVTGVQDRTPARPGRRRRPRRPRRPGRRDRQVTTSTTRRSTGRVRLRFPWLSDDYVSDWARTVQPGAGKDRGAVVLPEVGDEVLVAFEQGDFRPPVRARRPLQRRGHARRQGGRPDRRRHGRGQPALVGVPARAPDRPARRGRPDRGRHRRDAATRSSV